MVHFYEIWANRSDIPSHTDQQAYQRCVDTAHQWGLGSRCLWGDAQTPIPSESGVSSAGHQERFRGEQSPAPGPAAPGSLTLEGPGDLGATERHTRLGLASSLGFPQKTKGHLIQGTFLVCGPPPPRFPVLSPASPKCWLDGDPDVAPLSGGHPVPLCCPGFLLEKDGCLPTVGKDEERGDRAKSPHPHRTGTPANGPSPQHGVPSAPRRGLR